MVKQPRKVDTILLRKLPQAFLSSKPRLVEGQSTVDSESDWQLAQLEELVKFVWGAEEYPHDNIVLERSMLRHTLLVLADQHLLGFDPAGASGGRPKDWNKELFLDLLGRAALVTTGSSKKLTRIQLAAELRKLRDWGTVESDRGLANYLDRARAWAQKSLKAMWEEIAQLEKDLAASDLSLPRARPAAEEEFSVAHYRAVEAYLGALRDLLRTKT